MTGDAVGDGGRPGVLEVLADGELSIEGRLTVASNLTFLGRSSLDGRALTCVYKPISGENPLWDFPDGSLAGREVAAFEVSQAAGWRVVPPTVMRADGPHGPGMCQLWIEQDDRDQGSDEDGRTWVDVVPPNEVPEGWLPILRAVDGDGEPVVLAHADVPELRRLAVFDMVVNNADRKGGHVLSASGDGSAAAAAELAPAVGVDHGVSFHVDPKLRTVLWGWAGTPVTVGERGELARVRSRLDGDLGDRLAALITEDEIAATARRIDVLLDAGTLPTPSLRMPIPWPVF